jgi:hypothetical protein
MIVKNDKIKCFKNGDFRVRQGVRGIFNLVKDHQIYL